MEEKMKGRKEENREGKEGGKHEKAGVEGR